MKYKITTKDIPRKYKFNENRFLFHGTFNKPY